MTDEITQSWIRNESDRLAVEQGCFFDPEHGRRVVDFIEKLCRLSTGRWRGQKLVLIDWQKEFVMRLFGWRQANGKRRFRRAYLEIAKKNGKSSLLSALALYMLLADGENAPEIHINGCDREQASIIFTEAKRMVEFSPALGKRVEVVDSRKVIVSGHGRIVANSAEVAPKDGSNVSCTIFDELHRQPNRQLWDVYEYSAIARSEPLAIALTTAGESTEELWHEQRDYAEKTAQGITGDITFLGVVYRADPEADIELEETWLAANPSMGHTFSLDDIRRDLREAQQIPAKLSLFRRLRLNIVSAGENQFINMEDWDACDGWFDIDADTPNFLGIDLSSRDDLSAMCMLSGNFTEGFRTAMMFWLPKSGIERLERQHGVPYSEWSRDGLIKLTDGDAVDYEFIEQSIVDIATDWEVKKIGTDPWNAQKLAGSLLNKHGLPVQYVRQGFATLTDPTKTLLELILSRRLYHGGHKILKWHASNATATQDPAGNIKLSKIKRNKKIDGIAAIINALTCAIEYFGNEPSACVYDTPGNLML